MVCSALHATMTLLLTDIPIGSGQGFGAFYRLHIEPGACWDPKGYSTHESCSRLLMQLFQQAIAFFELTKTGVDGTPVHEKLIKESIQDAHWMLGHQPDSTLEELAVESMMVRLALNIVPSLSGYSHIQTNPRWSYDVQKTIKNAESKLLSTLPHLYLSLPPVFDRQPGIVSMFKHLAPLFDTKSVCIKIPATWEGLQACRELEKRGIATLATTLFCMEQAALAADAKCTYIAPYVNELKVHFEKG